MNFQDSPRGGAEAEYFEAQVIITVIFSSVRFWLLGQGLGLAILHIDNNNKNIIRSTL
jgi:hypothetical protein